MRKILKQLKMRNLAKRRVLKSNKQRELEHQEELQLKEKDKCKEKSVLYFKDPNDIPKGYNITTIYVTERVYNILKMNSNVNLPVSFDTQMLARYSFFNSINVVIEDSIKDEYIRKLLNDTVTGIVYECTKYAILDVQDMKKQLDKLFNKEWT